MHARDLKGALIYSIIFILIVGLPFRFITKNIKSDGLIQSMTCNIYGENNLYISLKCIEIDEYEASILHRYDNTVTKLRYKLELIEVEELIKDIDSLDLGKKKQELSLYPNKSCIITKGKKSGDLSLSLDNFRDRDKIIELQAIIHSTLDGRAIKIERSFNPDLLTIIVILNNQNEDIIDTNKKEYKSINETLKEVFIG